MNIGDLLISIYKGYPRHPLVASDVNVTMAYGDKLGELCLISRIPSKAAAERKQVYTWCNPENKFREFFYKWTPGYIHPPEELPRRAFQQIVEGRNCGPGNILQQLYRSLGLSVDIKPRGFLNIPYRPQKNKVGIHVDGVGAGTLPGFPMTRTIYPESMEILRKFVKQRGEYEFVQFGQRNPIEGANSFLGRSLDDSIAEMATCEFLICLNSSFMHIGAALDVKLICVIDNPRIDRCYFPVLVNDVPPCVPPYDLYDSLWLYPQAVHLHQLGENPIVPRFSARTLELALKGEVYPYFREDWLDMVFEYE